MKINVLKNNKINDYVTNKHREINIELILAEEAIYTLGCLVI